MTRLLQTLTLILVLLVTAVPQVDAQRPQGEGPKGPQNIGRFYGKVVDEKGDGVGYAAVQLFGKKPDPVTKTMKDTLWAGQLTVDNGDFSLEKLPVMGEFELVVTFIGYAEVRQKVSFGAKPGSGPGSFETDLGNIKLGQGGIELNEVTVKAEAPTTSLAIDRKSYRVDKDLTSAGGTAQDALKNVPSLSVDLDGNVSLRNGAPQIFIDGRPTTLTLDQIPASDIETVEVITNPSSKFDAGGGTAGIVNIVLKKEKRLGYNGNVRVGGDSNLGYNAGGDINARGEKINFFASGTFNQNQNYSDGTTFRQNNFTNPLSTVTQTTKTDMSGIMANARIGADYLMDNRNTITFSGNLMQRRGLPIDEITTLTEFLYPDSTVSSSYFRNSDVRRAFQNLGASVQFKHLFPKKGAEWTADVNFNRIRAGMNSQFFTTFDNGLVATEKQEGTGYGRIFSAQTDFVNPLNEHTKLEGGLKAQLRIQRNDNTSYVLDADGAWQAVPQISDRYEFNDNVFAAYLQASRQQGKWGFQAGLRAESSFYSGALTDTDSSFSIVYPVSLFPSIFATRKINDSGDQIQLAYTRRVNRPGFFQTMPFTDFTDSLNLRRGNPQLLPEFSTGIELTYQNYFAKTHNVLVSLYYKRATNVISSYQYTEINADLGREVVITGYANGSWAAAYGSEITMKNGLFGWLDLTSNLNVFQAQIDATNVESQLKINQLSAFFKETAQIKLPKNFSVQVNGEYRSRATFAPSTGNDQSRGGGPGGGGQNQNSAQGYSVPVWFVDASIRKDFLKNQAASVTLSVQDVFASRRFGSVIATEFFTQESDRLMNPQLVRLNFSYRFGKQDASLFNRKNNRTNSQGSDMM